MFSFMAKDKHATPVTWDSKQPGAQDARSLLLLEREYLVGSLYTLQLTPKDSKKLTPYLKARI